jgi:cell division cycle 20-like protein 1 (cofactor of APC complex)
MSGAHAGKVTGLEWNIGGGKLASGSNDNSVKVWDIRSSVEEDGPDRTFRSLMGYSLEHLACVKSICWSQENHSHLLTGGGMADRKIRTWNINTGEVVASTPPTNQVSGLHWSTKLGTVISAHRDGVNLRFWGAKKLKPLAEMECNPGSVLSMAINNKETMIATVCTDGVLKIWEFGEDRHHSNEQNKKETRGNSLPSIPKSAINPDRSEIR